MLLYPSKVNFKKQKKNYLRNTLETRAFKLSFGFIGLKATQSCRISARQIEAARQCINRQIRRKGKIWIRIFPSISVTKKPVSVRMGKGKGSPSFWCVPLKVGSILFEIVGVSLLRARRALKKAAKKLPIKTKIILKHQNVK